MRKQRKPLKRRAVLPKQKPRVHKDKKKEAKKNGWDVLTDEDWRWKIGKN